MPQKKNPDVAELTRGKTGRLLGNLTALMTLLKGLPMTYNRDLQEDKEPLFDSIDTIKAALAVFAEMLAGLSVREDRTRQAASDPMLLATDLADYVVKKGLPFRQGHEVIGKLVAYSLSEARSFSEFSLEEYKTFWSGFEKDVYDVLNIQTALAARKNPGAPSPKNVAAQLQRWRQALGA
jgi:argininosuccinate lyase